MYSIFNYTVRNIILCIFLSIYHLCKYHDMSLWKVIHLILKNKFIAFCTNCQFTFYYRLISHKTRPIAHSNLRFQPYYHTWFLPRFWLPEQRFQRLLHSIFLHWSIFCPFTLRPCHTVWTFCLFFFQQCSRPSD